MGLITGIKIRFETSYSSVDRNTFFIYWFLISIGNHMISSAIWDKLARINFSKTNQIARPVGRVQFVVFEKFTRANVSQIAREKSCDYLLIIHIQKLYTATSGCQTKDVFSLKTVKTLWSYRDL